MRHELRALVTTTSVVMLAACSMTRPPPGAPAPTADVEHRGSATIVHGAGLQGRGGSLIDLLPSRVSSMRVQRPGGVGCPAVSLRGARTILSNPNPLVFVDGARMNDTCVLSQIRAVDVSRVEVYPNGTTTRVGYPPHGTGLILVFLTGSE